jgi:excinuclease ABC subunit A
LSPVPGRALSKEFYLVYYVTDLKTMEKIQIRKAKVHNLKAVDVDIPRNAFTVITGPSGSGKSSLAFDTLYAEGQRRYIESLSSYARQFLGQMEPPDVESIKGLSPAIAIDQKSTSNNPRSTVGTVTEVYDYMRVLFARVGTAYCPESGEKLSAQTAQQIVEKLKAKPDKTKLQLLAPVIQNQKGEHKELLGKYLSMGYVRARVNGKIMLLDEVKLDKNKKSNLDIVVDRLVVKKDIEARLTDSVEKGLKLGEGHLYVLVNDDEEFYSEHLYSPKSGLSCPELEPRLFSFNSPLGACPTCNGIGESKVFDEDKFILSSDLSFNEGTILPLGKHGSFYHQMVKSIFQEEGIDPDMPFKKLPTKFKEILFKGSKKVYHYKFKSENSKYEFSKSFPGLKKWLEKKYLESSSDKVRNDLENYMHIQVCPDCKGNRLRPFSLHVIIENKSIMDISNLTIEDAYSFFKKVKFKGQDKIIADKLLHEIRSRLGFLNDVGLTYLTLSRAANTLSGGEAQRIRLATQIGSALSGVLYVLDEPSIGLHQRDNTKLIETLKNLKNLGNTVIVVEHDEETMQAADYLIDMGPGAGIHGGDIIAEGSYESVLKNKKSITASYLSGREKIEVPKARKELTRKISINKISKNNIKDLNLELPLGGLICVSGVSGSGKSTMVHQAIVPAVKNYINKRTPLNVNYNSISGASDIKSLIELDQTPIGRTPKSNPATYTKVFDEIRKLFTATNEAKIRGYKAGRFSFNVKGGRCESCEGNGVIKVEMNFLPDVYITCADCDGKRYNNETLSVLYKGKSIADVLSMSVEEALEFFNNHRKIKRILKTMFDVGLGYITLGQSSTTLSGGEAQRMKLSRELSKATKGETLYVLDEPTTGLHFQDIKILIKALNDLVQKGNTVVVIEHNLDVLKCADWLIDMGPEGGVHGGEIVAKGTPEEVSKNKNSMTGKYLKRYL